MVTLVIVFPLIKIDRAIALPTVNFFLRNFSKNKILFFHFFQSLEGLFQQKTALKRRCNNVSASSKLYIYILILFLRNVLLCNRFSRCVCVLCKKDWIIPAG